ncbi:MAG: CooT family nickel-binding protein [Desulfococcaceae bacterium]
MCEANAYLIKDGKEELIMEAVDILEPEGENLWQLVGIFGDQKTVKGKISGMNLVNHKIFFEPGKTDE